MLLSKVLIKIKVDLNLSNYATKNDLIAFKYEIDKLHINKLCYASTSSNNLKTKVDVGELKTVPIDLKKLSDITDKKCCKNRFKTN